MRYLSTLALLLLPSFAVAGPWGLVTGGKVDEANVVCTVAVNPGDPAEKVVLLQLPDRTFIPAQLLKQEKGFVLVFVVPKLKAGEKLAIGPGKSDLFESPPKFKFVDEKELLLGSRPVLSYFNLAHDPKDHFYTFKPFHHVYDPAEGKTLLTNGSAKTTKDGLFPHHRGLFFAFNKISYDGKTADIWHGTDNVFAQHDKVLSEVAGTVLGRQRSALSWHGKDGQTFINEERELTAYATSGGTLIDFASVVKTDLKSVKLDGDPQHAGFHFRANMEVAKKIQDEEALAKKENRKPNPSDTYYLRPDGKGKFSETRNWDPKGADPRTINMPWNAMSFVIDGKRYTLLRINHPDNPKDSRGSERDYGRFGDYFEYEVTPEKPLKVKYRVWVQLGEMTVEQCEAMAAAFVSPPEVKVFGAGK